MQLFILRINKKEVKKMKKETLNGIFKDIKYKLASPDLRAVADSLKEKSRQPRDWISVKTLSGLFEEMAKARSNNSN